MISVAEALARVVNGVRPLPAEQVGLDGALGRVLAEDVAARVSHPPLAVSSMDGYAVRSEDLSKAPCTLQQIGESSAGGGFQGAVNPGACVRIFTGAPVPEGADAVEMQENTEAAGGQITFCDCVAKGRFIRPQGQDFSAGDVLLGAGRILSPRDVGLAAAMNVPWLKVRRRPRVAILATGDELAMPGEHLGPAQIVSSNSPALAAMVHEWGGEPLDLGIAGDDEEALKGMLEGARGADMLVTIGGASVGDRDLVRKVLGGEGLELAFFRVAMRPGKPLIFGRLDEMPVLGLPGNPVSAGVTALVFLKPAMERMLGLGRPDGPPPSALLGRDLEENGQRQDYLRATLARDLSGALVATPFKAQDSAMLARFAEADCLVVRRPGAPPAKAGKRVEIVPLRQDARSA